MCCRSFFLELIPSAPINPSSAGPVRHQTSTLPHEGQFKISNPPKWWIENSKKVSFRRLLDGFNLPFLRSPKNLNNTTKDSQDSIQNIVQIKKISADSIQKIIQLNSQGIIDTGRIGKVPKNCPKSVQNRQKRGLFIKNGKYRFKI